MKRKTMKPVKAWAVLSNDPYELQFWGNGIEFQLPVFPSRHEAKCWVKRMRLKPIVERIALVEIREIKKKP